MLNRINQNNKLYNPSFNAILNIKYNNCQNIFSNAQKVNLKALSKLLGNENDIIEINLYNKVERVWNGDDYIDRTRIYFDINNIFNNKVWLDNKYSLNRNVILHTNPNFEKEERQSVFHAIRNYLENFEILNEEYIKNS